ncbi:MAG TPA: septal ring lytic transglycosylase RlpA family protein [Xanthobacteraceae bacterium]|nr:septal ring lytic transglycosylase RlpA family protein [Xanthobacteraceae bacterium]
MGCGNSDKGARLARAGAVVLGCLVLANCSSSSKLTSRVDPRYGVAASPRVVEPGQPVPKGGGVYRVGKPYQVAGVTYTPEENRSYRNEGLASWYGDDFHGRLTANGEVYDMEAISAAHPTMPMPSYARVTNLRTHKSLIVRVNDRGPYHANREIDVSARAADLLGFKGHGTARVRVEYVGPAPIQGTDDRLLMATLREGSPAPAPSGVMVASNRFLPDFGRRPSSMREGIPLPQDRPYDLGERDGRVASAYPRTRMADADASTLASAALARHRYGPQIADVSPDTDPAPYLARGRVVERRFVPPVEQTVEARGVARGAPWTPQPPAVSPVTAYAQDPIRAMITGRGLY